MLSLHGNLLILDYQCRGSKVFPQCLRLAYYPYIIHIVYSHVSFVVEQCQYFIIHFPFKKLNLDCTLGT